MPSLCSIRASVHTLIVEISPGNQDTTLPWSSPETSFRSAELRAAQTTSISARNQAAHKAHRPPSSGPSTTRQWQRHRQYQCSTSGGMTAGYVLAGAGGTNSHNKIDPSPSPRS